MVTCHRGQRWLCRAGECGKRDSGGTKNKLSRSQCRKCGAEPEHPSSEAPLEGGALALTPDWSRVEDIDLDEDESVAGGGEVPQTGDGEGGKPAVGQQQVPLARRQSAGNHCQRWSKDEEAKLRAIVESGTAARPSWKEVASQLGTGRTSQAVCQHWEIQRQRGCASAASTSMAAAPAAGALVEDIDVPASTSRVPEPAPAVATEAEGWQLHLSSGSSTGYKNVGQTGSGRFFARDRVNGRQVHLGTFDTAIAGAVAYARAVAGAPSPLASTMMQPAAASVDDLRTIFGEAAYPAAVVPLAAAVVSHLATGFAVPVEGPVAGVPCAEAPLLMTQLIVQTLQPASAPLPTEWAVAGAPATAERARAVVHTAGADRAAPAAPSLSQLRAVFGEAAFPAVVAPPEFTLAMKDELLELYDQRDASGELHGEAQRRFEQLRVLKAAAGCGKRKELLPGRMRLLDADNSMPAGGGVASGKKARLHPVAESAPPPLMHAASTLGGQQQLGEWPRPAANQGAPKPEQPGGGRTRERKASSQPRWNAAEEELLVALVRSRTSDWFEIATRLGTGRSAAAVQQHHGILCGTRWPGKARLARASEAVQRHAMNPPIGLAAFAIPYSEADKAQHPPQPVAAVDCQPPHAVCCYPTTHAIIAPLLGPGAQVALPPDGDDEAEPAASVAPAVSSGPPRPRGRISDVLDARRSEGGGHELLVLREQGEGRSFRGPKADEWVGESELPAALLTRAKELVAQREAERSASRGSDSEEEAEEEECGGGGGGKGGGGSVIGGAGGKVLSGQRRGRKRGEGETTRCTWVACDRCDKWRRLPPDVSKKLPAVWYCSMHPDPARRRCAAPEEEASEGEVEERTQRVRPKLWREPAAKVARPATQAVASSATEAAGSASRVATSALALGVRVRVLWEGDEWFAGVYKGRSSARGHCIKYDDGDVRRAALAPKVLCSRGDGALHTPVAR